MTVQHSCAGHENANKGMVDCPQITSGATTLLEMVSTQKKIVSQLAGRLLFHKPEQLEDSDRRNVFADNQGHVAGWRTPLALRS
jgi:hypothetical protein